ncbi:jg5208, partial [Pararge aegeria aegeria]
MRVKVTTAQQFSKIACFFFEISQNSSYHKPTTQVPKEDNIKITEKIVKKGGKETLEDKKVVEKRERSGTLGALPVRKEKETPKKATKEIEVRRSSDDRRYKR